MTTQITGYKKYDVNLINVETLESIGSFEVYAENLNHAEAIAFRTTTKKVASIIEKGTNKPSFTLYDVVNEKTNVSRHEYKRRAKEFQKQQAEKLALEDRLAQEAAMDWLLYESELQEALFIEKHGFSPNILSGNGMTPPEAAEFLKNHRFVEEISRMTAAEEALYDARWC